MVSRSAFFAWALVACSLAFTTNADFLNDYLNTKTFGADPGPCPDEARLCETDLDVNRLNPLVQNIRVCLVKDYCLIDTWFGCAQRISICAKIKEWVRGGNVKIWNLQCRQVGVTALNLRTISKTNTRVEAQAFAQNIQQRCSGDMYFTDVRLAYGDLSVIVSGGSTFTTASPSSGTNLDFKMIFTSPSFANQLPNDVQIPNNLCNINIGANLVLDILNGNKFDKFILCVGFLGCNLSLRFLPVEGLTNLLVSVFEAAFGGIICDVLSQSARTLNGQNGILNVKLDEFVDFVNDLSQGTPDNVLAFDADPRGQTELAYVTQADLDAAMDFSDNEVLELLSVTLNGFLGRRDEVTNRLIINDAIEQLLESDIGEFEIDLIQENIVLEDTIPLQISNVTIKLDRFNIEGLNTISEFALLENNFKEGTNPAERLKRTLNHTLDIDDVTFLMNINVNLARGDWVTRSAQCGNIPKPPQISLCTADSISFSFQFGMTLQQLKFDMSTFALFDHTQVDEIQIGQLLGQDFRADPIEAGKNVGRCLAPAFYSAFVPFMTLSIGSISDPVSVIPSQSGLADLIGNSINLVNDLGKSAFRLAAPGIFQGTIRPEINTFLKNEVVLVADLSNCAPYTPGQIPANELYLNFEEGLFSNIYPAINNVLGDFTDPDSKTDMNDLIQVLLEYYSDQIENFPIEPNPAVAPQGSWKSKAAFNDILHLEAFQGGFTPGSDAFIDANSFKIDNLNSIYALNAEYFGNTQNGISLDFSFGKIQNADRPLRLSVDWRFKVDDMNSMDETVITTLVLEEVEMEVDLDQILLNKDLIYSLRFRQLQSSPCLLSVLENIQVAHTLLTATRSSIEVNTVNYATGSNPSGLNDFQQAWYDLQEATILGVSAQFQSMVNTILNNGFANAIGELENFDTSVTPATCDSVTDPVSSTLDLFTGFKVPDITQLVATCVEDPTEPPLTPAQAEAAIIGITDDVSYFDFTDSIIVNQLEGTFGSNQDDASRNSVLTDILKLLANQSGTPLADAFFLEDIPDGQGGVDEVVSLFLTLNETNFLFDLFDVAPIIFSDDSLIPGMEFQLINLTVRGIDRFVTESKFLDVKSRFVHGYAFAFTEENPLIVEVHGSFEADGQFIGQPTTLPKIREDFQVQAIVEGFQLEVDLLTAINADKFANMSLGHFFAVTPGDQDFIFADSATRCLFSTFFENGISVTNLVMNVTQLDGPNLVTSQNIVSQEFENVLDQTIKLLTDFYIDAIPNIAYNCIRGFINDEFRTQWEAGQTGGACPVSPEIPVLSAEDQLFRFGTSQGIVRLNDFVEANFRGGEPRFQLWNDIIETLTTQPGTNFPITLFDVENGGEPAGFENFKLVYNGVGYGTVDVTLSQLKISGMNTFTRLDIIEPVTENDNFTTNDGFTIAGPVTFDFHLDVVARDVFNGYPTLTNQLVITAILEDIDFGLQVYAVINVTEALHIRFSSVSSLNEIPCVLVPVDALIPNDFNLSTSSIDLTVQCDGTCDFPLFNNIENGGIIKSDPQDSISQLINDAIGFLVDYIESTGAQRLIDAQLQTAEETCDNLLGLISTLLEVTSDVENDVALYMGYGFIGFMGATAMATAMLLPYHKKRRKQAVIRFVKSKKTLSKEKEIQLFQTSMKSLFAHPSNGVIAKFLIPLICVLNVFGLVVAIVFSGAINIILTFTLFGAETNQIVLVPFTIASTINDLWNSGAWFLALLIAVASCLWPVLKNLILMIIWFSPTTILSKVKRNKYLLVLDVLGKWSFLDVFVVVMTLAALRTYLRLSMYSRLSFIDDEAFEVDVNVTPERGIVLLCFIAATSLIINHFISWYHEKAARFDEKEEDALRGIIQEVPKRAKQKVRMKDHKFAGIDRKGRRKKVSKKAFIWLSVVNWVSGVMVMIGVFIPFVTFTLGGLIGLLLGEINEPLTVKTYSITDLGALVSQSPTLNGLDVFVVVFFQILFFLTSLIFPALQIVVNFCMFMIPMSLKDSKTFIWFAWIASFWAALECFLLGIVMTLNQIQQITIYILDFISDDLCSNIQGLLETILGPQNGACLVVEGFLEPGAPILFIGVLVQLIVSVISLQLAEACINDRYYQAYNGLRKETKPPKQSWLKKQTLKLMTRSFRTGGGARNNKKPAGANTDSIALDSVRMTAQSSQNPVFSTTSEVPDDIEV